MRLAALALALLVPAAAQAAVCGPADQMRLDLERRYGEIPVAYKIEPAGTLVELLASRDTGTWTLARVTTEGVACVLATGHGWRPADEVGA